MTPPAVEPAIAPIGSMIRISACAAWLHRPYSLVTYPVVVIVDVIVNIESRKPAPELSPVPDVTKAHSVVPTTTST